MYSVDQALDLSKRYFDHVGATIRSEAFREYDERAIRGLFVAMRRGLNLKRQARKGLLREQRKIIRRVELNGGWSESKVREFEHSNRMIDIVEKSLTHSAGMIAIAACMLDRVTTPESRADLLAIAYPERVHDGSTTLQALVSGYTNDGLHSWLRSYIEYVGKNQGKRDHVVEFAANMFDKELFDTARAAPAVADEWRHAAMNVVCRIRLSIRHLHERRKGIEVDQAIASRKLRKLHAKGADYRMAREAAILTMHIEGFDQEIEVVRSEIHKHADRLICVLERLDRVCSLAERCDLFNVNVADRGGLDVSVDSRHLIVVDAVEDSATNRGAKTGEHHVLKRAIMEMCIHELFKSQEGRKSLGDKLSESFFGGEKVICMPESTYPSDAIEISGEAEKAAAEAIEKAKTLH